MAVLDEKEIEKIASQFFEKLGVDSEIQVKQDEEKNILIEASGENLGILIGYHGETLEALQLLLGIIINNELKSEDWHRVLLDVGGWRDERQEALKNLVSKALARVKETRQVVDLPPMPASQRRFVHTLLSEEPEIEAHSELEGPDRHIVVSYKS